MQPLSAYITPSPTSSTAGTATNVILHLYCSLIYASDGWLDTVYGNGFHSCISTFKLDFKLDFTLDSLETVVIILVLLELD